ncbi:MAG: amidase [Chloroflexi bacterium]|nr:amidase [Chloroflexota bacterium]
MSIANDSLSFISASELVDLVRRKEISPVEIVDQLLRRISDINPKINAFLTVAEAEARLFAQAAEVAVMQGSELPPLHGVPFSIKDLHFTRGTRTTGGSLVYKDFVPDEDAIVVERLRHAGAILIGKTNTPEFGLSATTENRLGDDCRNPWDPRRTSGGSSGGAAAAAAAGISPIAIGSDRGGSIRIPAGFCGVYGFKPTHGRVPLYAAFAGPAFTHIGPIARTVKDAALTLSAIAGFDRRDPTSLREPPPDFVGALEGNVRGLRMAFCPNLGGATVDAEVKEIVESAAMAFETFGCSVDEVTSPIDDPFIATPIVLADQYAWSGHLLDEHSGELTPEVRQILESARTIPGYVCSRALRKLERFRMEMADFFERYDLLLTPTNPVPAFLLRQRPEKINDQPVNPVWNSACLTTPFNLTGAPAATVPCGFSSEGLPMGLQIAAGWGQDEVVIKASAAFERVRPWANKTPRC